MATLDGDAIHTAIREVLEDGTGSVRTISSGRFGGGLYGGQDRRTRAFRALDKPAVETTIAGLRRHSASPPRIGSVGLLELDIDVRIVRHATVESKLDDDVRDALKALAIEDADLVRQALEYPGNLTSTAASVATGIVSGCLTYSDSDVEVDFTDDASAQIATTHRFTGIVKITQATS